MAAGTKAAPIDVEWAREQFPSLALEQDGEQVLYLDNPAGTQVPRRTIDAIGRYFTTANANVHGPFLTSRRTDELVDAARASVAAFLGASAREVAFGPNMTTLTYAVSRALGREWGPGDELVGESPSEQAKVGFRPAVVRGCAVGNTTARRERPADESAGYTYQVRPAADCLAARLSCGPAHTCT